MIFQLTKGVYFSHGTRMFRITGVYMKGHNPTTVEFVNIHKSGEIITQPMSVMKDLMEKDLIKYEGLSQPKN